VSNEDFRDRYNENSFILVGLNAAQTLALYGGRDRPSRKLSRDQIGYCSVSL